MKKSICLLVTTIVISLGSICAQTEPVNFMVHEVIVKPWMAAQYREGMTKLKSACEQHKTSFGWQTIGHDDGSYIYLSPMKDFSQLGTNVFEELRTKMGAEALGKIWAQLDECTVSSTDYVVALLPELSYMKPAADENARTVTHWYPLPGKDAEARTILAEWKKLYESKKSPAGYRVYAVVYGREHSYALVSWGKDAVDMATKVKKSNEILGEENQKMWAKTELITKKYHNIKAWVMPNFSYVPAK